MHFDTCKDTVVVTVSSSVVSSVVVPRNLLLMHRSEVVDGAEEGGVQLLSFPQLTPASTSRSRPEAS